MPAGVFIDSSSIARFAQQARTFGTVGLPVGARQGVEAAALVVTTAARASIAAGSGGDSYLSNVGSGARVGARYDIKGTQNPTALIRATGPLHLLDNPTSPHRITAKQRRGRRRNRDFRSRFYTTVNMSGATPLRTPYGPRYNVWHPGTRGKRTFFNAVDATRALIPVAFRTGVSRAMVRHFR